MRKKEARALFKTKRAALDSREASRLDDLLLISFQHAELPFLQRVLSFYPADDKGENDTFLLTRYLQFVNPGLEVAYPRITADNEMEAVVPEDDDAFAPNSYNILEPTQGAVLPPEVFDLVLVPLLAFDRLGHRAGYGKGYYDRYLAQVRPDCVKAGLSYFEAVDLLEDAHEFDIPLDLCITPSKVYVF